MSNLDLKSLLDGNRVFEEFKGALTEQFILQQLTASKIESFYWSAENATSELDFIIKYTPKYAIRSSMSDFRKEEWIINFPLYRINALKEYLSAGNLGWINRTCCVNL